MTPESLINMGVAIASALVAGGGAWALQRRDIADLKEQQKQQRTDLDGVGSKVNTIVGHREADEGRFGRIENDIKDLRFLERSIPDRFTKERHDLIDREINPLAQQLGDRMDGLEDDVKDLKRGSGA